MIIPPYKIMSEFSGSLTEQSYREIGAEFAEKFSPHINQGDRVLEVGCGCARIAQSLSNVVYEGFDVSKEAIDWCKSLNLPNLNFQWLDSYNSHYNSSGKHGLVVFPYDDASFDFVYLTSVFTHVMPDVVLNYISEIQRVLKAGKACAATFFIIKDGQRGTEWKWHNHGRCWVVYPDNPDAIVGYEEPFVRSLMPVEAIIPSFQDMVVYRT